MPTVILSFKAFVKSDIKNFNKDYNGYVEYVKYQIENSFISAHVDVRQKIDLQAFAEAFKQLSVNCEDEIRDGQYNA